MSKLAGVRIADAAKFLPCSGASRVGFADRSEDSAAPPLTRPARGTGASGYVRDAHVCELEGGYSHTQ
jgi:hypothetical protein